MATVTHILASVHLYAPYIESKLLVPEPDTKEQLETVYCTSFVKRLAFMVALVFLAGLQDAEAVCSLHKLSIYQQIATPACKRARSEV